MGMMYNRRLQHTEIDLWMDMFEQASNVHLPTRMKTKEFLSSSNAVAFVTTKEEEFIGGTCIHKDPIRLGMVLSAIAVHRNHRSQYAYSLVKSSLPFFRTVAIRDVDALVAQENGQGVELPYSMELQSWTMNTLERAGFAEKDDILHVRVSLDNQRSARDGLQRDKEPRFEEAKELIWNVGRKVGLANSVTWTAFSFGYESGCLLTFSEDDEVVLLLNAYEMKSRLIVNPIVYDHGVSSDQAIDTVLSLAAISKKPIIDFAMVGKGQSKLLNSLQNLAGTSLSVRRLKIMRKML